jgi:hypothetical protein
MKSTEGLVPLTPPIQKSAVLCTQPPAGEHHTNKADDARQPKKALRTTHTPKRHATPAPAHTTPLWVYVAMGPNSPRGIKGNMKHDKHSPTQAPRSTFGRSCQVDAKNKFPRGLYIAHSPEAGPLKLELELIQTHMTQKPLLWVEVGAHAVRKRSECAGVV